MVLVVAYDVADVRRRGRLRKVLLGFGVPVQESVFECELTAEQGAELKRRVARVVAKGADAVGYYPLCERCAAAVEDGTGRRRTATRRVVVV